MNLAKTSSEEDLHSPEEHDGLLHGTKVMLNILQPWVNKQGSVASVGSYFSLVQACDELKKRDLGFIGVVTTETRDFCVSTLLEIELAQR